MVKNTDPKPDGYKRKFRLSLVGATLSAIMAILIFLSMVSVVRTFVLAQERRDFLYISGEINLLAKEFNNSSNSISVAAQGYAATGLPHFKKEIEQQRFTLETARARLERIQQGPLERFEIDIIRATLGQGEEVLALNDRAAGLVAQGRRPEAMALVLSQSYIDARTALLNLDQRFSQQVNDRLGAKIARLDKRVELAMALAVGTLSINFLMLLATIFGFYHRRVLRPLVSMTAKISLLTQRERVESFVGNDDGPELVDLGRALDDYQYTMGALEKQRALFAMSEAWFRHIIEAFPDGMLVVDDQGIIQLANPRVHEILSYRPGTLLGMDVDLLVPPDVRSRHHLLRASFTDPDKRDPQDVRTGDFRAVNSAGEEFPVRLIFTHMPYSEGKPPCVCVALSDISERKRWEQDMADQIAFQRVLLDTVPFPIFYKDANAIYTGCNQAFLDTFGVERDALIGTTVSDFMKIPEKDRPYYAEANSRILRQGGTFSAETELPFADGQTHTVLYNLAAFYNGEGATVGLVGIIIDISQQKESEKAMANAKAMAEEATRMKSDFLANMSHEIRTPMGVIMGMLYLALETSLDEKQRNYVQKAYSASQGLLQIINDILDFSKIEAGKLQFEDAEFELEGVLSNLSDFLAIGAREKGLELLFDIDADVPGRLRGDPLRLRQVLLNLMSNAVKFTQTGEIILRIQKVAEEAGSVRLRFEVIDTGIGLSAEQKARLFQAFSQADSSTSREYGGTGLGLAISQHLVERMEGSIAVESTPHVGSNFFFDARFGLPSKASLSEEQGDLTGTRILVIDDNSSARDVFRSMLKSMKFNVTTAASAREGLEKLERAQHEGAPFRLVLMDWVMPEMDGVIAIRFMREKMAGATPPLVIMITAYDRDELSGQLGSTRVDGLLTKPVTPSSMLDCIYDAFGKQAVTSSLAKSIMPQGKVRESLRGAHVLLAEDNQVNQEMTMAILRGVGISADLAVNGEQAVMMALDGKYDAVLMDCQMPVMDGFEATRRIRSHEHLIGLPVLALTANAMAGDKQRCMEAGMNDHIAKPIDVEQLFDTLARWIGKPAAGGSHKVPYAQPNSAATELGSLDGIIQLNVPVALKRLSGNTDLFRRLIERFVETQSDELDSLLRHVRDKDWPEVAAALHTIRGVAGNIGAEGVAGKAKELEKLIRENDIATIPAAISEFSEDMRSLLLAMSTALSTNVRPKAPGSNTSASVVNEIDLQSSLAHLEALLLDSDAMAGDELRKLVAQFKGSKYEAHLSELQAPIKRYDFDKALGLFANLKNSLV